MTFEIQKILKSEYKNNSFLLPLLNIDKCPEVLYFKGSMPIKNKNTKVVSIIGSRKITSYGRDVINKLLSEINGYDIIIVSGLALGCDSEAHRQAINNKLTTIAFPGSGIDDKVLYPQTNIKLAKSIIDNGGAVMSEFEPDKKAALWTFPARNRILAAISDLIIIVEAEEKSGTQITARLALEYGKDLAIVPGSIFSIYSKGTVGLWKDGAYPVTCGQDIIELLKIDSLPDNQSMFGPIENNVNNTKLINNFSDIENKVLNFLNAPIYKDELLDMCMGEGLAFDQVLGALITLESKGVIKDNFDEIKRIK